MVVQDPIEQNPEPLTCPACGHGGLRVLHEYVLASRRTVYIVRCIADHCHALYELERL